MQHADDGYSRCGNFGSSLVHLMFSVYSASGPNVSGSRGGEFEGWSRCRELKVVKLCSDRGTSYSLVQTLLLRDVSFSHNTFCHRQTDRDR